MVARKPPPDRASANAGSCSGGGGTAGRGERPSVHGTIRSLAEVPIAGESVSGVLGIERKLLPSPVRPQRHAAAAGLHPLRKRCSFAKWAAGNDSTIRRLPSLWGGPLP